MIKEPSTMTTLNTTRDQLRAAYLLLQEAAGFNEGDQVRVLRTATYGELGWNNSWTKKMDKFVGNVFRVVGVSGNGILLRFSEGEIGFRFPFFVLEKGAPANKPLRFGADRDAMFHCEGSITAGRTAISFNTLEQIKMDEVMNKATTCMHPSFDARTHDYCPDCGETDTFRVIDERRIAKIEAQNAELQRERDEQKKALRVAGTALAQSGEANQVVCGKLRHPRRDAGGKEMSNNAPAGVDAKKSANELLVTITSLRAQLAASYDSVMRAERERDDARAEKESLRAVLCAAAEPFRAEYPDEWRTMAAHRLKTLRAALEGEVE